MGKTRESQEILNITREYRVYHTYQGKIGLGRSVGPMYSRVYLSSDMHHQGEA